MHDPRLLDKLSRFSASTFDGEVYRATPLNLNPLSPSTAGGRWSPRSSVPVLYTSLERDGALAEISYHWSLLDPIPTKPVALHRIRTSARQTVRISESSLGELGVELGRIGEIHYKLTQDIGAAVAFLGHDGLIIPSARWRCENLILFAENSSLEATLQVLDTEEIDWRNWARSKDLL